MESMMLANICVEISFEILNPTIRIKGIQLWVQRWI